MRPKRFFAGQPDDDRSMPLDDFVIETFDLLREQPDAKRAGVDGVKAERVDQRCRVGVRFSVVIGDRRARCGRRLANGGSDVVRRRPSRGRAWLAPPAAGLG